MYIGQSNRKHVSGFVSFYCSNAQLLLICGQELEEKLVVATNIQWE